MTAKLMLFGLLLLAGCNGHWHDPAPMPNTHKVWLDEDSMMYESDEGFGCGRIERIRGGRVYSATVINWEPKDGREPETMWNSLQDAEKWIERWCKP